jgi:hypothetical protein
MSQKESGRGSSEGETCELVLQNCNANAKIYYISCDNDIVSQSNGKISELKLHRDKWHA